MLSAALTFIGLAPLPTLARAADVAALSDANIAAIVLAANTIDIKNGEMAVSHSKNKTVLEFAHRMTTDHAAVNAKAVALATKLGLKPVENETSRGLVASTGATRKRLARLHGAAFDRAYIDNEVAYHQAVIGLLDGTIVPAVQNAELKDLLVSVHPAFVAHLDHAKMVQSGLKK
jgi:putative membrane protein